MLWLVVLVAFFTTHIEVRNSPTQILLPTAPVEHSNCRPGSVYAYTLTATSLPSSRLFNTLWMVFSMPFLQWLRT